jgi:hypothetical protein
MRPTRSMTIAQKEEREKTVSKVITNEQLLKAREAIARLDRNRELAYENLMESDGYEASGYLENMNTWIAELQEVIGEEEGI